MISEHPCFLPPDNPDVRLWRYMDLAKLLSMLQRNALFFSRAHLLGDPFEGSTSRASLALRDYVLRSGINGVGLDDLDPANEEKISDVMSKFSAARKYMVKTLCVNCWHMNERESAAMWRLYSKSDESVCVQTTYGELASLLPHYVNIGTVHYADYENDVISDGNLFGPLLHKRRSYEHEREIRAVAWEKGGTDLERAAIRDNFTEGGLHVPVDLNALIKAIYVNPTAPSWFHDVVTGVTGVYGIAAPVIRSSLANDPVY